MDPNRAISQYIRNRWDADKGFPGGAVYSIVQTTDGYLWIGAEKGLVRFDGLKFRLFNHTNTPAFPASPVLGLTADSEGTLWIRLESPGLLRYRGDVFQPALPDIVHPESGVTAMCLGQNGEVLLDRPGGPLQYIDGKLVKLSLVDQWPGFLAISMAETADGKLWLGTRDTGLFSLSGGRVASIVQGLPDKKINSLLPMGDRELWIGTDNGIARWSGSKLISAGLPKLLEHVQTLALARDRESNIWAATHDGLLRINAKGVASLEKRSQYDGAITALFEDREGDLWIGSTQGIEQLRDNVFMTYSTSENPHSENNGPIYVDAEERTWFAPADGGLFWLKGSQVEQISNAGLDRDIVYSIAGGGGELWVGRQRGGLTRLENSNASPIATTYTQADGLPQNSIYAVHRNRDGTVWVGTLNGGVSKFKNGKFTTYTTTNGLASNTVSAIAEGSDGTMWFATPNGLNALSQDHWRIYTDRDGLPPGSLNCLWEDSAGILWIGTAKGVAFLDASGIHILHQAPDSLYEEILGIAEDRSGWIWLSTSNHVLRVKRSSLLAGALDGDDLREYGVTDGLRGTEGVRRYQSVTADPLGRIWFSLNRGISVVDPVRLMNYSAPTLVHIQTLLADGNPVNLHSEVHIPASRQRITFGYTGLSLSVPERVQFRYTLDGFDHEWSSPVAAREAVYMNLNPGSYRFRVRASNSAGLWNSKEASIGFSIDPAFWQTWWFRLISVAALLLAILIFFRFRMHQMTKHLNLLFEERLAERTRIAQELHDTLLQGFLSASMQLHVAVDRVPDDSPAKPPLNRVLQLMSQVIEEGRNAVRGLRSSSNGSFQLEQAFSRIPQELAIHEDIDFRVIIEGKPRPLHPVLRDEVYRIGREALVNAFRHSQAKKIELELQYAASDLRMLVRDNGCGIDPRVLRSGRDGHWGLPGMRERAERIGARLNLWSSASAGTEVVLSVPSQIAFQAEPSRRSSWFAKLYPRKAPKAHNKKESE